MTKWKNNISVIPIIGSLGFIEEGINTNIIAKNFAQCFGGVSYLINSPAVLESAEAKRVMNNEEINKKIFELSKNLDVAIVGASDLGPESTLCKFANYKTEDFEYLIKIGVKGAVNLSFLDKDGNVLPNMVDERISFENIKDDEEEIVSIGNLTSVFMMCSFLRGAENFLMDMAANTKLAEKIVNEVADFCLEYSKRELEAFGSNAEYYGTWDDVAGQDGILFSPELFKKYFLPVYKKLIENVKKHNLIFGWHVCGSVHEFMPYMIDAGIDVFDVVQTSAKNMDLETIYKLYGNRVCIHGSIDVQKVLLNKKPEEIKDEVKKIFDLWGNRGGVIIAPSHMILPETPVENILAVYEANK